MCCVLFVECNLLRRRHSQISSCETSDLFQICEFELLRIYIIISARNLLADPFTKYYPPYS